MDNVQKIKTYLMYLREEHSNTMWIFNPKVNTCFDLPADDK